MSEDKDYQIEYLLSKVAEMENYLEELECDEFVGGGFFQRSFSVLGYWLAGVAMIGGGFALARWLLLLFGVM